MAIIKVADLGISSGVNKPSFQAWLSGSFTAPSSVRTLVPFNVVSFDNDNSFNTSNNRFIAPSAGRYMFHCTLFVDDLDDGDLAQIWFFKNGSRDFDVGGVTKRILSQDFSPTSGRNLMPTLTAILDLSKDDYVQPYINHDQGSDQNVNHQYSYFTGCKLIGT
mgnify:CR=1 FL=1